MKLLKNEGYQVNDIVGLYARVGMICLDDWLLKITASGRHQ